MVGGINNAPRVKAQHPFVRMAPRVSDSDQALPPTTIGTRLTQLHWKHHASPSNAEIYCQFVHFIPVRRLYGVSYHAHHTLRKCIHPLRIDRDNILCILCAIHNHSWVGRCLHASVLIYGQWLTCDSFSTSALTHMTPRKYSNCPGNTTMAQLRKSMAFVCAPSGCQIRVWWS